MELIGYGIAIRDNGQKKYLNQYSSLGKWVRFFNSTYYEECNYDMNYNNVINPVKYSKILEKIPEEVQKNIVISLNHYEKVYQEYKTFIDINKNKTKLEVQYPELELILPKDD